MARKHRLVRRQLIPCSAAEAFAFFSDATNLEAITPPFLRFQILTPAPILIQPGTLIDYRLRLFGMPITWQTLIDTFEPNRRFTDTQLRGPYRRWHHLHEFTPVDGGTLMTDCVEYELSCGALGALAHALVVRRTLERIFDYRRDKVAELLGATGKDLEQGSQQAHRVANYASTR
jgi:hypothetical protein